jgi:hypothetical protein
MHGEGLWIIEIFVSGCGLRAGLPLMIQSCFTTHMASVSNIRIAYETRTLRFLFGENIHLIAIGRYRFAAAQ